MNIESKKAEKGINLKMLEQLIDNHQSALLKFAFFILGSMPDAEDVVQETFVKFYRSHALSMKPGQKPICSEWSTTHAST